MSRSTSPGEEGTVPLPLSVKTGIKDGLVALSLANLCLVNAWSNPLATAAHGYFNHLPLTAITFRALLTNLLSLTLVAWLVMRARRRFPNLPLRLVIHVLFFLLLLVPLDYVRAKVLHIADYSVVAFLQHPVGAGGALALLGVVLWQHERVASGAAALVVLFSPLALLILFRAGLLATGLSSTDQGISTPTLAPCHPVRAGQPRVVWLIFDELDYRLAFEQRPPGVRLTAFDRFREESICATNANSPGDNTTLSMPALISGRRLSAAEAASATDLRVTLADTGETNLWSHLPSVFEAAQAAGFNTALLGWFHPYDRVLGRGLNWCTWYPFPRLEPTRAPRYGSVIKRELLTMVWPLHMRLAHAELCRASLDTAHSLVTNANYGLLLLHLPVPHTPGIYDPQSGRITIWGIFHKMSEPAGYLNNLALADRALGELMADLGTAGELDNTWVILSADHSWRFSASYDGRRDFRVPFLVRAPHERVPSRFGPQMNTVVTHDLILAILQGQLHDQQDAVNWLEAHRVTAPTERGEEAKHER